MSCPGGPYKDNKRFFIIKWVWSIVVELLPNLPCHFIGKAVVFATGEDDVIQQRNIHQLTGIFQVLRHMDVCLTWLFRFLMDGCDKG